jgi:carbon storage regulator
LGTRKYRREREAYAHPHQTPGESLYLGENIKLKVLSIQGKQIKLGLDVPEDMTVYREEVYLKIKEQNSLALEASGQDLLAAASLWQEDQK